MSRERCCCRDPRGLSSWSGREECTGTDGTASTGSGRPLSEQVAELETEVARLRDQNTVLVEMKERLLSATNGAAFLVRPFPVVSDDKAQALKPLEEAAEAFGAWQLLQTAETVSDNAAEAARLKVVDECADVIQAAVNLAAAMGVDDMSAAMLACYRRNHERGRC